MNKAATSRATRLDHRDIISALLISAWLLASQFALAQAGDVRIVNRWKPAEQLHLRGTSLQAGPIRDDAREGDWQLERIAGEPFVRLRNRASGQYLHNERGGLEVSPIQPNWWSAMWQLEPVAGSSHVRLRNRWKNQYLHIENGLTLGDIQDDWWSAMWELRPSSHAGQPVAAAPSTPPAPSAPPPSSATGPSQATDAGGFQQLLRDDESLVGEPDFGAGAVNLAAQIESIKQAEPQAIPARANGAWQWADFIRRASGTEFAGTSVGGHIQGLAYSPRWGFLATETATPGDQSAYLLGLHELSTQRLQGYLIDQPSGRGYAANVDAAGDFFVVAATGDQPVIYRIGKDGAGNTRIRKQCEAPGERNEIWSMLAYHPDEQRMYYFDGTTMYRAPVRGGVFCTARGGAWQALPVSWPTRYASEMENTNMIYDRTSGDFYVFLFNKKDDNTYAAYERLRVEGDRVRALGNAETELRLRFPAVHTLTSFRSAGAAGTTPEGRLVMAVPYHTLLADFLGVVTLDTTRLQGFQWTATGSLDSTSPPSPPRTQTSSDLVGYLMCAVDDRSRSAQNWVRLGASGGYWPLIGTRFANWKTGIFLQRDVPNQPRLWELRFAPASGKPSFKLGYTAFEEDQRGSWAVAQTSNNERYVFTEMDGIELIPAGNDGWFRIQGRSQGRGLRHLSCRHYEPASTPRERLSLQWRSSTSAGDTANPIAQLFRLCRNPDAARCDPITVP